MLRDNGRYLGGATYRDDEENRGVVRNELIIALAAQLPKGSLHLSSDVQSVKIDERGARLGQKQDSLLPSCFM